MALRTKYSLNDSTCDVLLRIGFVYIPVITQNVSFIYSKSWQYFKKTSFYRVMFIFVNTNT